jgi:toxin ParE1/3/4
MAAKTVKFHEQAEEEAIAAFDWYLDRSEAAASKFLTELDHAIEHISFSPSRWPEYVPGTRRFLLRRFPFAVIYREIPSHIQIVAVAHTRRLPYYWKRRV